jgi:hypothetical protein
MPPTGPEAEFYTHMEQTEASAPCALIGCRQKGPHSRCEWSGHPYPLTLEKSCFCRDLVLYRIREPWVVKDQNIAMEGKLAILFSSRTSDILIA